MSSKYMILSISDNPSFSIDWILIFYVLIDRVIENDI